MKCQNYENIERTAEERRLIEETKGKPYLLVNNTIKLIIFWNRALIKIYIYFYNISF